MCTKYISPAIKKAGWDVMLQVREVSFTNGRVKGKTAQCGECERADYLLYYKPELSRSTAAESLLKSVTTALATAVPERPCRNAILTTSDPSPFAKLERDRG